MLYNNMLLLYICAALLIVIFFATTADASMIAGLSDAKVIAYMRLNDGDGRLKKNSNAVIIDALREHVGTLSEDEINKFKAAVNELIPKEPETLPGIKNSELLRYMRKNGPEGNFNQLSDVSLLEELEKHFDTLSQEELDNFKEVIKLDM